MKCSAQDCLSVLIADDNLLNCQLLSQIIKKLGHSCHFVTNGEEVLEHLQNKAVPDILLLDIHMPVLDGIETLKYMQALNYGYIESYAFTADTSPDDIAKYHTLGFAGILPKPLNILDLDEILYLHHHQKKYG